MSVKMRITAWITGMMLIMAAFVIVAIFVMNGAAVTGDPQGSLVDVVVDNADDLEMEDGEFRWKKVDFYRHGVFTIILDPDGNVLRGAYPVGAALDLAPVDGEIRTVTTKAGEFYVYDMYHDLKFTGLWVRGMIPTGSASNLMHILTVLLWAIVPGVLVLSIGGGWLVAWLAFRPMEKMIRAADSINNGNDLSKRIGLKKGPHEMKRLGKTFDSMFDRLEKSFEAEKQFASDASHELRTPLAVMQAEIDRAKRKNDTVEDYKETLGHIEEQGDRMKELIDQLLSITRLQQGTERYPMKEDDLSLLVGSVCEEFVPGEKRGITIETDIEEGIRALFNQALTASILQNLLENANKYGSEGGVTRVSLKKAPDRAILSVRDNGRGIAPENIDRIWQRFFQEDSSRGIDFGSGLGLSFVKEAAELQRGEALVESELGQGSTFIVTFILQE